MNTIELEEVHAAEIKILEHFISFCTKNNLKYYLIYGSCLGAIRHDGFIPWDDDIDVGMPREDFEKFHKLYKNEEEPFFLQTYETDPEYYQYYSKLRDSSTSFIEYDTIDLDINKGIFIDIFPIEYSSKCNFLELLSLNKLYILQKCNILLKNPTHVLKNKLSIRIIKWVNRNIFKNSINNYIRKVAVKRTQKKCKYYSIIALKISKKNLLPSFVFDMGIIKKFENLDACVPYDFDTYLKSIYGNYRKLPSTVERINKHKLAYFSNNKGYKEYAHLRNSTNTRR